VSYIKQVKSTKTSILSILLSISQKKLNPICDRADTFQERKNTIYSLLVQPDLSQLFSHLKLPNDKHF